MVPMKTTLSWPDDDDDTITHLSELCPDGGFGSAARELAERVGDVVSVSATDIHGFTYTADFRDELPEPEEDEEEPPHVYLTIDGVEYELVRVEST